MGDRTPQFGPEAAARAVREVALPMVREMVEQLRAGQADAPVEGDELLAIAEGLTQDVSPVYLAALLGQMPPTLPDETRGQYAARLLGEDGDV